MRFQSKYVPRAFAKITNSERIHLSGCVFDVHVISDLKSRWRACLDLFRIVTIETQSSTATRKQQMTWRTFLFGASITVLKKRPAVPSPSQSRPSPPDPGRATSSKGFNHTLSDIIQMPPPLTPRSSLTYTNPGLGLDSRRPSEMPNAHRPVSIRPLRIIRPQ